LDGNDERVPLVREQREWFVKRVIDEVIATGVDIDQRHQSETMLMAAADGGQPELVRYLLDLGADATLENDKGQSALDITVREGRRLTAFWDEDEALATRFAEVIELLGGTADMLNAPD
jgi:ankyrin repeat protein